MALGPKVHLEVSQRISACLKSIHWQLKPETVRGAPEIDVFEIQSGDVLAGQGEFTKMTVGQPYYSASYQFAPDRNYRPKKGEWPLANNWYREMWYGNDTSANIIFYGNYNHFLLSTRLQNYWHDAISLIDS